MLIKTIVIPSFNAFCLPATSSASKSRAFSINQSFSDQYLLLSDGSRRIVATGFQDVVFLRVIFDKEKKLPAPHQTAPVRSPGFARE